MVQRWRQLLQMATPCVPEDLIWRERLVDAQMARKRWAMLVVSRGGQVVQGLVQRFCLILG